MIDGDRLGGLNRYLKEAGLDEVFVRLRKARLIARPSTHEETIDAHPIVREHFGRRLEAQHPKSWREGHRRLYEHHKSEAGHQPDDLAGMRPLFAAVVHGCAAGLHQKACDDVYRDRIIRGQDCYLVIKLGAFAAELSCLSQFFAERWNRPEPALTSADQSWVLANAGFLLRGLGRLRDAAGPIDVPGTSLKT